MPSPTLVPPPGLWIGCTLSILLATQARSSPIEMTISGNFDSNYFVGGPITPQTVTLPDGFSDPSTLGPIALVSSTSAPARLSPGFPRTGSRMASLPLINRTSLFV